MKQFMQMEDISPAKFADAIGIQRSGISHLLAGRNKPSFDFITKMLSAYPDLNADWLLTGKGKPYKNSAQSAPYLPENDTLFNSPDVTTDDCDLPEESDNEMIDASEDESQPSENPVFDHIPYNGVQKSSPQMGSGKRSIVRVTIFYSDGTYEEK